LLLQKVIIIVKLIYETNFLHILNTALIVGPSTQFGNNIIVYSKYIFESDEQQICSQLYEIIYIRFLIRFDFFFLFTNKSIYQHPKTVRLFNTNLLVPLYVEFVR